MKTNTTITVNTLNGHYLESGDQINADYLCEEVEMWAMNTQSIYEAITNSSRKITSIVWESLVSLTNDHIKSEGYNYQCESYQLKKWLNTYGNGYETLTAAVEALTEERQAE